VPASRVCAWPSAGAAAHSGSICLLSISLGRPQRTHVVFACADEYWEAHPELHKVPIYYASSLAKKCMTVYQTYINMMNENIRCQLLNIHSLLHTFFLSHRS
jgi:cleavage and polyadenylation specificity factor subunit 3